MAVLSRRNETDTEIVITFSGLPVYLVIFVIWCFFSIVFNDYFEEKNIQWILGLVMISFLAFYFIDSHTVKKEIREAMKTNSVQVSGQRFSFKNPMKYRIMKKVEQ